MKKAATSVLCIILLLAYSHTAFALGLTFMDEIKEGNYLRAIEIYKSSILGNAMKETQAEDDLEQYLADALDQFINDQISDPEIRSILSTVEKVNNETYILFPYTIADTQFIYREVSVSKSDYANAVAYMENGNYASAMEFFGYVSSYDTKHYDIAQRKIEECEIALCNLLLDEAEEFANSGNYYEAFIRAKEVTEKYPDIAYSIRARDRYSALYVEQSIREARALYESTKDHAQAAAVLKKCLGAVGSNEKLESEIAWYEGREPVSLLDIPNFISVNQGLKKVTASHDIEDNFGIVHDEYPVFKAADFPYAYQGTVPCSTTYYLDGEYSIFSGTIFLSHYYKDSEGTGFVHVYGDGKLLFAEDKVTKGYRVKDFTVDVTGVQELKVELSSSK